MQVRAGDMVRVREDAPLRYSPGAIGCVLEVRGADSELLARALEVEIGAVLCRLELSDGTQREIPEEFLVGNDNA